MGLNSRIWFSRPQAALILVGLECLVNRLAGARAGCFPFRNPWDRIDFQASDIYRDRAFNEIDAAMILRLRNRVQEFTGAAKIQLDVFELAAISFATRVSRMSSEQNKGSESADKLTKKIEMHRKRAKLAAIGRFGHAHFEEHSAQWRRFVRWVRYNLLSRYTRRPSSGALRRVWKEQYEALFRVAETAIAERQFAANPPEGLPRIVRLAMAELRRGRHPFTIREVCSNGEDGKTFLFEFALARKAIRRIHEDVPLCIRQSDLGEKFRAALQNSSEIGITAASTLPINVSKPQGKDVRREPSPSLGARSVPMVVHQVMPPVKEGGPSPVPLSSETINNEQIADAVARWLKVEIDPGLREQVCVEAQFQVTKYPMRDIDQPCFISLKELITKTRVSKRPGDVIDMLNFSVDWLLDWLLVLRRDPLVIHGIIGVGYARAMKDHGLSAA